MNVTIDNSRVALNGGAKKRLARYSDRIGQGKRDPGVGFDAFQFAREQDAGRHQDARTVPEWNQRVGVHAAALVYNGQFGYQCLVEQIGNIFGHLGHWAVLSIGINDVSSDVGVRSGRLQFGSFRSTLPYTVYWSSPAGSVWTGEVRK